MASPENVTGGAFGLFFYQGHRSELFSAAATKQTDFYIFIHLALSSAVQTGKLSLNEDRGPTDRVTALPGPYDLDIDL